MINGGIGISHVFGDVAVLYSSNVSTLWSYENDRILHSFWLSGFHRYYFSLCVHWELGKKCVKCSFLMGH